jgi:hypothetical protein
MVVDTAEGISKSGTARRQNCARERNKIKKEKDETFYSAGNAFLDLNCSLLS